MAVITEKKTHVWILKEDSMGGPSDKYHDVAFINEHVAEQFCKDINEEWRDWTPEKHLGEEISGERIIVNRIVYSLNKLSDKDDIKKRAIEKLSEEERKALGLI